MALPRAQAAILAGWLGGLIARAGEIIFAACDEEAGWRGWRIGRPHGGLTRVYRDPAFDLIVRSAAASERPPAARSVAYAPALADSS